METDSAWIICNVVTPHSVWLCVVTCCLLLVSALVAGAETAFFALSKSHVRRMRLHPTFATRGVVSLLDRPEVLRAEMLLTGVAVDAALVVAAAECFDALFCVTRGAWALKLGSIVVMLWLFGGLLPKSVARIAPMRFACVGSVLLRPLLLLFGPLASLCVRIGDRVGRRSPLKGELSIDELADAVDRTQTSSHEEHEMLSGIVNFVNTEAVEIMKPRVDITAVALTDSYERVKETIIRSGFSRIPVYDGEIDRIRGTLYVKDLLPYIDHPDGFRWQSLLRKPYFVPENMKISDLLEEFQTKKVHMAIVVDEYGSTLGLVSLEDIIEEIVGEISDESDTDESFYKRIDDRTYLFDGKTHIGDFERVVSLDEDTFADVRGEAETLGGLLLELKGDFPQQGDRFESHGVVFTVESLDGRRVDKLRVVLPSQSIPGSNE